MEKTSQDVQVHPNQMDARGKDENACGTVQMIVELVGEDELQYGEIGRLVVVPAEAPIGTHAGRLVAGQHESPYAASFPSWHKSEARSDQAHHSCFSWLW
ncbi:hypothetical protein F2Q69_00022558 [Brassica cretica]|uniref:Uncharacterized protein n=1 Tax=Brassica cretica TaxID=69181 RepID=A0A8S9Q5R7_BRACR|nr:hypothetical protein F2Q69_00022558 [Brassica cretica]